MVSATTTGFTTVSHATKPTRKGQAETVDKKDGKPETEKAGEKVNFAAIPDVSRKAVRTYERVSIDPLKVTLSLSTRLLMPSTPTWSPCYAVLLALIYRESQMLKDKRANATLQAKDKFAHGAATDAARAEILLPEEPGCGFIPYAIS